MKTLVSVGILPIALLSAPAFADVKAEIDPPKGAALLFQPQVAANVVAIGWQGTGAVLPSVSVAPSVRIGAEWPGLAVFGNLVHASTFGIGPYSGAHFIALGPDIQPTIWRSADKEWSAYFNGGLNGGVFIVTSRVPTLGGGTESSTDALLSFGAVAGIGLRDETSRFRPGFEAGTRLQFVKEPSPLDSLLATSSLYVGFNCNLGGQGPQAKPKQETPKEKPQEPPKVVEAPPPPPVVVAPPPTAVVAKCPDARKEAEQAEDEARAARRKVADVEKRKEATKLKLDQWRDAHKDAPRTEALNRDEDAVLQPFEKAMRDLDEAAKAYDAALAKARDKRAVCDPAYQQPSETTCGPAAIRMVVKSVTGQDVGVDTICRDNPAAIGSKKGTEVKDTPDILGKYKVKATLKPNATIDELKKATDGGNPAIVVVDQSGTQHAVVVDRVIDNGDGTKDITGRDPLRGAFTMPASEFDKWWKKTMITTAKP